MLGDTLYLDNIEEYVQDENKIVTYKWLSRSLDVPVNSAKQMLYTYVTRCRSNSGTQVCADSSVTVTYLVTGIVSNGGCKEHQVLLVDEDDLEDTKKQFTQLLGTHIYSVQKIKLKESCSLYAADYDVSREHVQDYSRWSTIDCLNTVVRSAAIKKEKINQSENVSAKTVTSEHRSSPPKLSHMGKDSSSNQRDIKTVASGSSAKRFMSGKHKPSGKTSTKSKAAAKGSVKSFFNRKTQNGNENNTVEKGNLGGKEQLERKGVKEEKASDDVVPDKEPLPHANSLSPKKSPKKLQSTKEDQPHQDAIPSMFPGLNESDIDDGDTVSEDEQPTRKQPKPRQPAKSKRRSKDPKQEKLRGRGVEGEQQRKRKRIQELPSDEEFSDNENLTKTFTKKHDDREDDPNKVGGSSTKKRKRVQKLVSKMYMNDDEEMVTEKLWELVSTDASDEEQDGSESSMERKKFKGEDKSESSDIQVKSEKQSPLKQNITKKQSSLMSFFKK